MSTDNARKFEASDDLKVTRAMKNSNPTHGLAKLTLLCSPSPPLKVEENRCAHFRYKYCSPQSVLFYMQCSTFKQK